MAGSDSDFQIIGFFEETGRGMTLDPDVEIVFGPADALAEPQASTSVEPRPDDGPAER